MADEINRASPRTQSALLQAMQEKEVSVAGQRRILPRPFHVLATQNPIEQEGTYPLPEAQLDRFLLQIDVDYPDRAAERAIILATTGIDEAVAEPVFDADEPDRGAAADPPPAGRRAGGRAHPRPGPRRAARARPTPIRRCRDAVSWGPGPRAAQALMLAIRARALIQGRLVPGPRRRGGAGASGADPPHGARLRRPRRGPDARRADRAGWSATSWAWRPRRDRAPAPARTRQAAGAGRAPARRREGRAARCRRCSPRPSTSRPSVAMGFHGRRRAGHGENFWQYRQAVPGDARSTVDWRRSGKSDQQFIREMEWEAAQTVSIWVDDAPVDGLPRRRALPGPLQGRARRRCSRSRSRCC